MCIDSIALARLTRVEQTIANIGNPLTLKPSPDRIAVRVTTVAAVGAFAQLFMTDLDRVNTNPFDIIVGEATPTVSDVIGQISKIYTYETDYRLVMNGFIVNANGTRAVVLEYFMLPSLAKRVAHRVRELQHAYPSESATNPSTVESLR